eukprot:m.257533 g.257533  ORF g.257533 m.257533 type:complete len:145 (+) comp54567_c0_seq32:623-1057(+)
MCVLSCSVSECLLQRGLVCSSVVKEKPPDAGTRECADCLLFSSEPDSESSEPTKPTNEPPRNKATTPGLVGESAVAASSDRTAPGEVFSQGFVGSFPFVFVASSKDWSSSFAFRFRCLSFGPFIACSHLRIFHRSMLQAASETT